MFLIPKISMNFGIVIPKVSINFGIRLFFLRNPRRANTQFPSSFLTAYDVKQTAVVTPDNWMEWVV